MSLKDIISRFRNQGMPDDEVIYEIVGREIESGDRRIGLWAKAMADAGWDENAAKARYVEYRAAQITEALAAARPSKQRIADDAPEEAREYLGIPIRADKYSRKYRVSRKRLDDAIARARIRAYKQGDTLWVEDRRIK